MTPFLIPLLHGYARAFRTWRQPKTSGGCGKSDICARAGSKVSILLEHRVLRWLTPIVTGFFHSEYCTKNNTFLYWSPLAADVVRQSVGRDWVIFERRIRQSGRSLLTVPVESSSSSRRVKMSSSVAKTTKSYSYRSTGGGGGADVSIEYSADLSALSRLEVNKYEETIKKTHL